MDGGRVEFVDTDATPAGDDDLLTVGDPDGGRSGARWGIVVAALVVLAVVATALIGRAIGGDAPSVTASPSPGVIGRSPAPTPTPVVGLVGLPRAITTPREMVAASVGDVVWMRDSGAGIVRLEGGVRTAVQLLESQVTAMAVSPSGDKLYVATSANRPSIQVLDATTLALGRSRSIEGSIQAITVSTDAVWAATGSRLERLDLDSLDTLDTVDMPGVVLTDHLRMQTEQTSSNQQYVVGVVTGSDGDGPVVSRFVRVNPLTGEIGFGTPLPGVTDVATAQFLTWVTTSADPPVTQGYASVLDRTPQAQAAPALAAGSRIYDGGDGFAAFLSVAPGSSVVTCHDGGGFATSEIDVAPALPDAQISGEVLRTDSAFYVITDRGLVREGVGDCR